SGIVQQPTQVAPIKRLANNTPSISEQDLVNVVPRTQKSRFGFVKKSVDLAAVREDPPHVSPVKPAASSRISGAWKKVVIIIKEKELNLISYHKHLLL
ncbi:unnamed protein product, partial [Rotaria sp. Silwood1]